MGTIGKLGCVGLLAAVGFAGATPVQAQTQTSLVCTRDLCRVLRPDGEVLSSCRRGEACGTRHRDADREPAPVSCPALTEETIREHTDVASCLSMRDGRIVSCCWVGDTCHSDPGDPAVGGRDGVANIGINLEPTLVFGGLASAWAGVSDLAARDSLLLVSTTSEPFLHLFRLTDGELVRTWGRAGNGPNEFRTVGSVMLSDSSAFAVDTSNNRLSVFDLASGELARSMSLTRLGLPFSFADEVAVWAPVGEDVAYWPAESAELWIMALDGVVSSTRSLPFDNRHEVIDLVVGPTGDIWVLRTPTAGGQVWDVVGSSGAFSGRVELPVGWRLMSVLRESLVVVVADAVGAESVQVHSIQWGPH